MEIANNETLTYESYMLHDYSQDDNEPAEVIDEIDQPKPAEKNKQNRSERFRQINSFCDEKMKELDRSEITVWLSIWRRANGKSGLATVAQTVIVKDTGCSMRTVKRSIKSLADKKMLVIKEKGNNQTHKASTYKIGMGLY